jgi:transposase
VLDLPWMGVSVRLDLTVRRFFCDTSSCTRKIFTERLPEVVAPSARRTLRLTAWLTAVGLALGGAAGGWLLRVLGVMQCRSTVLRQVSALSLDAPVVGPAIGIDEFAFRRGRRFGTIIVELATRRVLDLLPTVAAEQVIAWLRAHPQIQVVSRDRAYNFGEAIRQGAPQAQQVADRWHLLKNLGEHLEAALRNHKAALRTPRGDLLERCDVTLGRSKDQQARGRDEHERQLALFHRVKEAQARGLNPSAIAKLLGVARPTAYKYARMSAPPDRWRAPSGVLKPLAAYVPYIYQRWNEGCRNATQVYRELRADGRLVSRRTVTRYMAILRKEGGHGHAAQSLRGSVRRVGVHSDGAPGARCC